MKGILISVSDPLDREAFSKLWEAYLLEMITRFGSEVKLEALPHFEGLFDRYVASPAEGFVLIARDQEVALPVGVLLWGGVGDQGLPTTFGKVAMGFGTYVVPSHRHRGVSKQLRLNGKAMLLARGFDTLLGAVLVSNNVARSSVLEEGFQPHQVIYSLDLRKVAQRKAS